MVVEEKESTHWPVKFTGADQIDDPVNPSGEREGGGGEYIVSRAEKKQKKERKIEAMYG